MKQEEALKQIMQTNKMVLDQNHTIMMSAYEQNKLLLGMILNQTPDLSPEGKSAIADWLETYRKGSEEIKKWSILGIKWWKNICPRQKNRISILPSRFRNGKACQS
ncbi:hypothetical protein [Desulfosarcina sp.]|uniref:hypothetical protein n=1 Tax=Desulfosarcina sp. TaxID=2027861 RepID=UPI00356828E9